MFLRCVAPRAGAALVAVMSAAGLCTAAAPAQAAPSPPPCPASVVPGVPALPGAVGCWNAIAVQTARRANVFPIQGLIAVSAPQLAVYDAVTEIAGRYAPYHAFSPPPGTQVAGASVDASIAAAAHATLVAAYPAQAAGPTGLDAQYAGYVAALRADGRSGIDAGVAIGDASARDLLAFRAGDRDESITDVPQPLSPGGWTFAPAPSLQSAQTPWVATMRPFTLASPSQFRPAPPPPLSSADGRRSSTRRRPTARRRAASAPRSRPRSRGSGTRRRSTSTTRRSRTSPRRVGWTPWTPPACSRWATSSARTPGSRAGTPSTTTGSGDRSWRSATPGSTAIPRPRGSGMDAAAHHAEPPGVPRGARLPHGVRGGGARDGRRPGPIRVHDPRVRRRDDGQLDRHAEVRAAGRPAGADRERPRVGRAALPRIGSRRRAGRNRRGPVDARSLLRARARP